MIQGESIEYICDIVKKKANRCKENYIVGIDGYSCSGKTTLSKELIQRLKKDLSVYIFHIDDHITTRKCRYNTGKEQWYELFYLQWDAEYIRDSLLLPLKRNEGEMQLKYYNKNEDSIEERSISIEKDSIIIIEGVYLQRIEWKECFDFVFFIDCPREIRFQREIIRSGYTGNMDELITRYKQRYWAAEDYYENEYCPRQISDIVISNHNK